MGMFKVLKSGWKACTPVEKATLILKIVCSYGMGAMCGAYAEPVINGTKNKAEKVAIFLGAWGLGAYLGDKSGEALGQAVGSVIELNQVRKTLKDEAAKEEQKNG